MNTYPHDRSIIVYQLHDLPPGAHRLEDRLDRIPLRDLGAIARKAEANEGFTYVLDGPPLGYFVDEMDPMDVYVVGTPVATMSPPNPDLDLSALLWLGRTGYSPDGNRLPAIGGWYDEEQEGYELAISLVVYGLDQAMDLGRYFDQRYIWSVENACELKVNPLPTTVED